MASKRRHEMSVRGIGELARSRSAEYLRSSRVRKGAILDEFVLATGVKRKTAIVLLREPPPVRPRPRGRPGKRYGTDVAAALEWLWATNGYLCSERLVPSLPLMMDLVEAEGAWGFSGHVKEKLLKISVSTCERLLGPHKAAFRPAGRCMTRPGSVLKSQIPVRTWADWSETEPGFCEMDLVHHCDNDTHGEYIHTLTLTDVILGWTEVQALRNRSERTVASGVDSIRLRLPYPLKGLDSDGGGEFINQILFRYCQDKAILFTRGRPSKKNDQCRVEQKNRSVVRENVGYDRYEGDEALRALNAYYRALRLRVNFLQPCMILTSKERVGAKVRRHYGLAMTPCQRVLEHACVSPEMKERLKEQLASIRPAALAKEILRLREELRKFAR
jgi:hypothetical protein